MNIEIEVKDQRLTAKSPRNLVAGTAGLTTFTASFDESWAGLKKTLIFESVGGGGQRRTVELLLEGSEGQVPWEVLEKPGTLWISAMGVSEGGIRCPTALMATPLYITPSGATVGSPAGDRTPELWEQAIIAAKTAAETVKVDVDKKLDKPLDDPAVGKILKIKSVNEDGTFACEWADESGSSAVDQTSDWELINTIEVTEDGITSITFNADLDGNPFELIDAYVVSNNHKSLGGTSSSSLRSNFIVNGKTCRFNCGNLSSNARIFSAIIISINNCLYCGVGNFSSSTSVPIPLAISPFGTITGSIMPKNDPTVKEIKLYLLNPGESYFAVGYTLTLYGRRKK